MTNLAANSARAVLAMAVLITGFRATAASYPAVKCAVPGNFPVSGVWKMGTGRSQANFGCSAGSSGVKTPGPAAMLHDPDCAGFVTIHAPTTAGSATSVSPRGQRHFVGTAGATTVSGTAHFTAG